MKCWCMEKDLESTVWRALCVLVLIMVSGCLMFYTGSEEGPFEVVAVRNEPGRPQEAILQSECRANWEVVFGPDGGGPTYFKGIRYYIASGGRTNDILFGTWKVRPKDYDHYDYVVIDVRTGKWHKLPFDTDHYRGFAVDVAAGCVRLRPRRDTCRLYNALRDEVLSEPSRADWPGDPAGYRFAGIENGVGMVYVGQGNRVLVGWDGKLVKSGALSRKGVGDVRRALGHGRFAVRLFDSKEKAVLSADNRLVIRGCDCLPYPDGLFLLGTDPWR